MKKLLACFCATALLLSTAGCASLHMQKVPSASSSVSPGMVQTAAPFAPPGTTAEPAAVSAEAPFAEAMKEPQAFSAGISKINKHGNVILSVSFDDMKSQNMEVGDIITVSTDAATWDMPIGTSFTDVDIGSMICRFDTEDQQVMLGINGGSFAETSGIAEKKTISADPGYEWAISCDSMTVTLKEKGGYADEYSIRNLQRTDVRSDYADLSDEEFANFRSVSVSGIKPDTLYRSSSPLDARLGRSSYAMEAMKSAGIKTVLNLQDSESEMQAYEAWPGSYYSTCSILNETMGYDYASETFAASVKDCILFIANEDAPYLIHCMEGKDRTGVLCAILEAYAGASYQEILDDYMQTYQNYFGVEAGSETYSKIVDQCLNKILRETLGVEDPETANLQQSAEAYLLNSGCTEDDLLLLRQKILAA